MARFRTFLAKIEQRDSIIVRCPFRTFLGVRCPGCGMTHALVALLRGDIRRAMRFNPFVLVLVPLLALGLFDLARHLLDQVSEYCTGKPT